ncbi:MAG TPA: hypothetical protein VE262_10485, partial [Blastocatellia bacterium]|nr:hypothetical protein [Blastocatellia bacterium]
MLTANRLFNFGLIFILISAVTSSFSNAPEASVGASTLSLEERVEYQRKIEEVYWSHREWPSENGRAKPTLSEALSTDAIRAKVEDGLRKSSALEKFWEQPITSEQLQAEVDRMAAQTKNPELLRELFRALDDDPFLIAECLARPILADRLARNWYAYDARFHGELRARAESDLNQHSQFDRMRSMSGTFAQVEWVKVKTKAGGAKSSPNEGPALRTIELSPAEWESATSELLNSFDQAGGCPECGDAVEAGPAASTEAAPSRRLSALREDEDRFYVIAVESKTANKIKVATVEWPKRAFEHWWSDEKAGLDVNAAEVQTEQFGYRLAALPQNACADDKWRPTKALPEGTGGHTAVWTGTEMIVWGGGTLFGGSTNTGARYNPATDTWTRTSAIGAPAPRYAHVAVWTGTEMIVWGGCAPGYHNGNCTVYVTNNGGLYDPVTNTWAYTSTVNAPSARTDHTAVWTGTEMIVWGGHFALNTGGRYNPATNTWTQTNLDGAPSGRRIHTAVWTGSEMTVWGGMDGTSNRVNSGARYNPASDSWAPTNIANAPSPRVSHSALWTGTEMIIWGGNIAAGVSTNTGGRYNPASDSWASTGTGNAPALSGHRAVWTGSLMVVWGGGTKTGGRYNPATEAWQPTDRNDAPSQMWSIKTAWTGSDLIVWGEENYLINTDAGWRYNPATYTWSPVNNDLELSSGRSYTLVWTGTDIIIWGGQIGTYVTNAGGRYNPLTNAWAPVSTSGAPEPRANHTAIWTGSEMIVWGGAGYDGGLNTGGRYNPATDSWRPTGSANAPVARYYHTAAWAGGRMVVWGGIQYAVAGYLNSGGRYDPVTDSWQATSLANAPEGRYAHSAISTGPEMIVWGGKASAYDNSCCFFNTGGRYNPATDTWWSTGAANAPEARSDHTAVWTGSHMIVWGGLAPRARAGLYIGGVNTGGRYDPVADSWSPTSLQSAPSARSEHAAVWTGTDLIIWGGLSTDTGSYTTSGGHYCAEAGPTVRPANASTTGVFRPTTGSLFLKNSNSTGFADLLLTYGIPNDYPVAGDWDGDGVDSIGVYRDGNFFLRNSNTNGMADMVIAFGTPGDQPVVGDWNGDGVDTIGVFRNGTFMLRNSNTAGPAEVVFGLGIPGDVGIAGDWDGDGVVTTGVFRPSNGALFLKNSNTTGFADILLTYGLPGDRPIIGDWNGDGTDTIGVYRDGTFHLRNSNTNGFAEIVFSLGVDGDMPI